jgi:uncharacterized protein (TIGR02145 family)
MEKNHLGWKIEGTGFINFGFNLSIKPIIPVRNIKNGYLYNWEAISHPLFTPNGCHVPTKAEFETLIAYLGGNLVAGGKLKEEDVVYWANPNVDASNDYGLNIRGSGVRGADGIFSDMFGSCYLATNEYDIDGWNYYNLFNYDASMLPSYDSKIIGLTVRLISDLEPESNVLVDFDGNIYNWIQIGTQWWLDKNWACKKLKEGTPIPDIIDNTAWSELTTMGRCAYNNDVGNVFL